MELICKITDKDIGEKFTNMENPKLRLEQENSRKRRWKNSYI